MWLWSGKARGKTGMQTSKFLRPTADIRGRRPGSVEGDMLSSLHDLLLSSEIAEDGRYIHSMPHERKKLLKRFSFFGKSSMVQLKKCDCSAKSFSTIFTQVIRRLSTKVFLIISTLG